MAKRKVKVSEGYKARIKEGLSGLSQTERELLDEIVKESRRGKKPVAIHCVASTTEFVSVLEDFGYIQSFMMLGFDYVALQTKALKELEKPVDLFMRKLADFGFSADGISRMRVGKPAKGVYAEFVRNELEIYFRASLNSKFSNVTDVVEVFREAAKVSSALDNAMRQAEELGLEVLPSLRL